MEKLKKILKNPKILIPIIGIIIGIITIYIGISMTGYNIGLPTVAEQYGGDAYTGIQKACAQTATNTYLISQYLKPFCICLLIVLGALIVLHYAERLFENIRVLKGA